MTDDAPATGRYLIYSVVFGEAYRPYATMLVRSIREIGKWPYDIVLLGDSAEPLAGCEDVPIIDIRDGLTARYPWFRQRGRQLRRMKTQVEHYVDLSGYDYVLYLDGDILVTTDRLRDLVPALCREQAIVVQRDVIAVELGKPVTGGKVLTKEEQVRWGAYAINAGIVGLPTTPMGRRLLRDWHAACVRDRFRFADQGHLISLLLRKYYGQWGFLGDAVIGRELKPYPQTFVHFTNLKDVLMERYYREILGLSLAPNDPIDRVAASAASQ